MGQIYQKTVSDKTCILAPREFLLRPFDFGAWTELRLGMYFDGVLASDDNTDSAAENVALNTSADKIMFGLKNSDTNDLPGVAGSLFLGLLTPSDDADSACSATQFSGNSKSPSAGAYAGVTLIDGASSKSCDTFDFPSAAGATGYNGFYVAKFVIANLGLATQTVDISTSKTSPVAGTDYSAAALRLLMNNAIFGTARTVAWNTGAVARVIPDAVFIRMPFYSNRIRLSAIRAIRYAP